MTFSINTSNIALFTMLSLRASTADALPCKQACDPSKTCAPTGECVSRCNPTCGSNEICSADGSCVSACNPTCGGNEVCSPNATCVSRCNPSCTGDATCLPDGTCETPAASVAPSSPAARTLVESDGRDGSHPDWTLFAVGAGIFGTGWIATAIGANVVCADAPCELEPGLSFLPLFGTPAILALGVEDPLQIGLLIAGETIQLTGFILAIVGLATTVDSKDARIESPFRMVALPFTVTPVFAAGFTGLQALGHF